MKIAISVFVCMWAVLSASLAVALTSDQKQTLGDNLKFYEKFLQVSLDSAVTALSSSSSSCSYNNIACNPLVDVPAFDFAQGIPAQNAYVQPKEAPGQSYATKLSQVCQLVRMGPKWLQNYNASKNKIAFQYFTYPDAFAGFYPQSAWNCSEVYIPTERPYYVSGATGARDVVILVDASSKASDSAWRLATAKKIATKIVRSLSFKDYVAIVAYGDQPDQQVAYLTQASSSNIDNIIGAINNVTLFPHNGTNIGAALTYAFNVFAISQNTGLTSSCTQMVVLLSGGDNSFSVPKPGVPISNNLNAITFPFLITTNMSDDKAQLMRGIACASNSVTRTFASDDDATISQSDIITSYFSTLFATPVMRWSEVYNEDDGAGRILTVSSNVFVNQTFAGVVSLDAPVKFLNANGTISDDMINQHVLSSRVCASVYHRDANNLPLIRALQNDQNMCDRAVVSPTLVVDPIGFRPVAMTDNAPSVLQLNTHSKHFLVFVALFVIAVSAFPLYLNFTFRNMRSNNFSENNGAILAFLICWLVALYVMCVDVAPRYVKNANFTATQVSVLSSSVNSYRCCEISGCAASTGRMRNTNADRCMRMIPKFVSDASGGNGPFTCSGGYFCFNKTCSDCHCFNQCDAVTGLNCVQKCDSCCECHDDVPEHSCQMGCGTCHQLTAQIAYTVGGSVIQSTWNNRCNLASADSNCRDNWVSRYSNGTKFVAYVNPENRFEVVANLESIAPALMVFLLFAGMAGYFLGSTSYRLSILYQQAVKQEQTAILSRKDVKQSKKMPKQQKKEKKDKKEKVNNKDKKKSETESADEL